MSDRPAILGSASPELRDLLSELQRFYERRDRLLQDLLGGDYGHNRLTEELVRRIVLEFCQGRVLRVHDHQNALVDFGSRNSFRASLKFLEAKSMVVITSGADDHRERLVWPTQKLVSWYEKNMPLLAKDAFDEIRRLYGDRP